jgi:hypothetical protein
MFCNDNVYVVTKLFTLTRKKYYDEFNQANLDIYSNRKLSGLINTSPAHPLAAPSRLAPPPPMHSASND